MNTSYLFLATGFEDMEAITTVDILRRAGINVVTVSIYDDTREVKSAHGVTVTADATFAEIDFSNAEWLILPGGLPGATNLAEFKPLTDLLVKHNSGGGNIAAICASPAVVLGPLGILDGREAVCYPGVENSMQNAKKGFMPVVADGNVITGNGPAAAVPFALSIVAKTKGEEASREVAEGMLLYNRKCQNYYF